jgi:histidyl-tRNA synthetase
VATALRKAGIASRLSLGATQPGKHLQYAEACQIEWVVFVGEDEAKAGVFPLKHLPTRTEERLSLDQISAKLQAAGLQLS